ncbi:MAG: hypothetical protein K2Y42_20670 [Hyphomicrobium sp.]|jgi:hypothetical protein|uniref:hypothetical protein n=1 Tax=Hyphomicrobium sp. TaxID=82 RepID=UPI0025C13A6C|nr:hypothetical protein [Hyphomicrobium sp.]MBX9865163.1 hypothetical protein [Hyphomicrobium sp.]
MSRKTLTIASLSTIVCALAADAAAEDFKSSRFLTYTAEAQANYISTSAVAAASIAALNSSTQAKCLGDWVSKHRASGYQPVLDAMRKYPDDHPTGLILAVLQKECGAFKYVN